MFHFREFPEMHINPLMKKGTPLFIFSVQLMNRNVVIGKPWLFSNTCLKFLLWMPGLIILGHNIIFTNVLQYKLLKEGIIVELES